MKHLLPPVKQYFKASLHAHSTVSDGKLTPEEVRDAYREEGFQILAMSDHSVIAEHQHLNLPDFLMLTSSEISVPEAPYIKGQPYTVRCRHLNIIGKDPYRLWQPMYVPEEQMTGYYEGTEHGGMPRTYHNDNINAIIRRCNEEGFLVIYNHPVWSLEYYPDYIPMKGLWGFEYRNTGSILSGYDENNSRIYDDFLQQGNRMVPVIADDMHSRYVKGGIKSLGGGWVMVGAEKLEYGSVMEAMERGDVYASCGPEIKSLVLDGDELTVVCSPAVRVQLLTQTRHTKCQYPEEGEAALTRAVFKLTAWREKYSESPNSYIRLVVTAADGTYAVTRAYWKDELLND